MASTTEAKKRLARDTTVSGSERHDGEVEVLDQEREHRSRVVSQFRTEDDRRFRESGSADRRVIGDGERLDDGVRDWFAEDEREEG